MLERIKRVGVRYRNFWIALYSRDRERGEWFSRYGMPAGVLVVLISISYDVLVGVFGPAPPYVTLAFVLAVLALGAVGIAALVKIFGKWALLVILIPALLALIPALLELLHNI